MVIEIKMSEIISIKKKKKSIMFIKKINNNNNNNNNNNKEREIISIIYPLILWNWKLLKMGPKKMN